MNDRAQQVHVSMTISFTFCQIPIPATVPVVRFDVTLLKRNLTYNDCPGHPLFDPDGILFVNNAEVPEEERQVRMPYLHCRPWVNVQGA